jgi:hypothetical protein
MTIAGTIAASVMEAARDRIVTNKGFGQKQTYRVFLSGVHARAGMRS